MARKKKSKGLSDAEILVILKAERASALGEGDELSADRERAYDYMFGKTDSGLFASDLPVQAGQSAATSSDVSDAIETVLPDLMEIFTAGDDVVAFAPTGEEDEAQARQETDYINHVFHIDNEGWMTLYSHFKDALASKTGVFKWWWEECEEWDEIVFEDKTPDEWRVLRGKIRSGEFELADKELDEVEPDEDSGLYTVRCRKREKYGKARIITVPPEDFRVDPGATSIRNAGWAGHYSRQRAYELVEQGFDPDKVALLQSKDSPRDPGARARVRESDDKDRQQATHGHEPLRQIETFEYHAWLDTDGDGRVECWKIITGNDDTVLLDKEQISGLQFAVDCPYPITHRLYGRSLADLLLEVQKIKTALTRLMLNAFYFGTNPRPEVVESRSSRFTLSDLMNNKPGRPIRVREAGAINWQNPPQVGDSVLNALEYMATVGENRTGVVRNAQGLNPDTLHDTAKGAMELMSAAQRRVRMIARIFAETGVKDMFTGLHDLIVRHGTKKAKVRLRREWVEIDPNKWGRRKDLTVEVGLGSNTKSAEVAFWRMVMELQASAQQFGLVEPQHFFNAVSKFLQAGNAKNPERFFVNPEMMSDEARQAMEDRPDPATVKVQGELQLKTQEMQQRFALDKARQEFEGQLALYKAQIEAGLAEQAQETEIRLATFKVMADVQTKTMSAVAKSANDRIRDVRMGGEIG